MNRKKILELIENGLLDEDEMIMNFVRFLSEDQAGEFLEFIGRDEEG